MEKHRSKFRIWLTRLRTIAAWLVIPAFLSMFMAHDHLTRTYPVPFPSWIETPRGFELTIAWRNYSLLLVVATSLIALPRWQSVAGLVGTAVFLYLWGSL